VDGLDLALTELKSAADGFVRSPDHRVWWIRAADDLRDDSLRIVMAAEHHPANRGPFICAEHGHAPADPGWRARVDEVRKQYGERQTSAKAAGGDLPDLPPPPTASEPRAAFAQQLWQLGTLAIAGSQGLTVVLAPRELADGPAWSEALKMLVADPRLKDLRWVILETDTASTGPLVQHLGTKATQTEVRLPPDAGLGDLAALVAAPASAIPGAQPEGATPAHPSVTPPAPPESLDPQAKARLALREHLLGASLAMHLADHPKAIERQRQARDVCQGAGMTSEAVTMETLLGTYLLSASQPTAADAAFVRAIEAARKAKLPQQLATAELSLGASKMTRGDRQGALVHFAEATVAAEGHAPLVAIEAARTTGQVAAELRMEPQAIAFWGKAVKLAQQVPVLAQLSSANLAARGLATLCRKRGLHQKAAELEANAVAFETARPLTRADDLGQAPPPQAPPPKVAPPVAPRPESPPLAPARPIAASPPANAAARPIGAAPPASIPRRPNDAAASPPSAPAPPPPSPSAAPPLFVSPPPPSPSAAPPRAVSPLAPAATPPLAVTPPSPPSLLSSPELSSADDEQEGTDLLSIEEIGAAHGWSPADIEAIRRTTMAVLDAESTSMLTQHELAQLRGDIPLVPPAPPPVVDRMPPVRPAPTGGAVPPSAAVTDTEDPLAAALAKMAALREVSISDETDGGSRMVVKKPKRP